MAIAYVGQSSVTSGAGKTSGTTLTVNAPGSLANGDFERTMIVVSNGITVTTLSGWTLDFSADIAGTAFTAYHFHKFASSEPSSYTWTISAISYALAVSTCYSGVNATNPYDTSQAKGTTTSGTASTTTSVTSTDSGEQLLAAFAAAATVTPADSYTPSGSLGIGHTWVEAGTGSVFISAWMGDSNGTVAIGAHTGTLTDTSTRTQWGNFALLLRPAAENLTGADTSNAAVDTAGVGLQAGNLFDLDAEQMTTDDTKWGASTNSTVTYETAQVHKGTHSIGMTSTASGNTSVLGTETPAVVAGNTYRFNAWIYSPVTTTANLEIDWHSASTYLGFDSNTNQGGAIAISAGWNQVQLTTTAITGSTLVDAYIQCAATTSAQEFYLSEIWLVPYIAGGDASNAAVDIAGSVVNYATDASNASVDTATVAVAGADASNAGADTAAITNAVAATDTGSGLDAAVHVGIQGQDVGVGADSAIAPVFDASNAGADAATVGLQGADASAVSVDVAAVKGQLPGADTANALDVAGTIANSNSDLSTGVDTGAVAALLPASDAGSGLDSATAAVAVTGADTGTGDDETSIMVYASDAGAGDDEGAINVNVFGSDAGSGVESVGNMLVGVADTFSGLENGQHGMPGNGPRRVFTVIPDGEMVTPSTGGSGGDFQGATYSAVPDGETTV